MTRILDDCSQIFYLLAVGTYCELLSVGTGLSWEYECITSPLGKALSILRRSSRITKCIWFPLGSTEIWTCVDLTGFDTHIYLTTNFIKLTLQKFRAARRYYVQTCRRARVREFKRGSNLSGEGVNREWLSLLLRAYWYAWLRLWYHDLSLFKPYDELHECVLRNCNIAAQW